MMGKRRNPLAKEKFLEGNRQKWALFFIFCGGCILWANMKNPSLQPEPYLTFLMMIGCVFLGGMSLDSFAKIKAMAPPPTPAPTSPPTSYPPAPEGHIDDLPFEEEEFDPRLQPKE